MKLIVTTITRSPRGNPMRASREINAEQVRVGRAAECELRLADPRVPLHAKSIQLGGNGPKLYDAMEQNAEVTGVYRAEPLLPGMTLKIGPFQVDVTTPPAGADLALTVELVQPLPGKSRISGKEIFEHARRGPVSKRALSWSLFGFITVMFLAIPVLTFFLQHGAVAKPTAGVTPPQDPVSRALSLASDRSWNPGELASGHQAFAGNCKLCHSESFTRVKDADCTACHRNMGDHVDRKTASVPSLQQTRCASCHQDHKGTLALQQQNNHYFIAECGTCHGNIKAHMASTKTADVSDFASRHPEFRVTVSTGPQAHDVARVRLPASGLLTESGNLKFPHDVHLDPGGVKGPAGRVKLTCGSCHVPDASGVGFKPVTMKDHCQSCHELRFEIAAPDRQVPHGNVGDVMTTLREFYSYLAVNHIDLKRPATAGPPQRNIPGKAAPQPVRLGNSADVDGQVAQSARELFEKTSCITCHVVTRDDVPADTDTKAGSMPSWRIAPVVPAPVRMPATTFSHASHAMTACSSCHAARTSKSAHDVLMPGITSCRSCHGGSSPAPQKVVSNCGMCHAFHVIAPASLSAASRAANARLPWPAVHDAMIHGAMLAPVTATPQAAGK